MTSVLYKTSYSLSAKIFFVCSFFSFPVCYSVTKLYDSYNGVATKSLKALSGKEEILVCDNKCLLYLWFIKWDWCEIFFSKWQISLNSLKLFKICQILIKYLVTC